MTSLALIVIYNHRFDENIEVVEKIYGGRFSHIFHLVPFYTGNRPNVIPVYENSYYFQGYIAQSLKHFYRETFTHYFFIADDLILNPRVDERNFIEQLGLPPGHCFLPGLYSYHGYSETTWSRVVMAYEWKMHSPGLEAGNELPAPEEALRRFRQHGLDNIPLKFEQIWQIPTTRQEWLRTIIRKPHFCVRYLLARLLRKRYHLPYPLVGGYADIFIVTADSIRLFSHYCGVLSAMRLFVEHAIPTAMVLAAKVIATQHSLKLSGKALWTESDKKKEFGPYGNSLSALLANFPASYLFLHPIKLSKWSVDLDADTTQSVDGPSILSQAGYRNDIVDFRLDGDDLAFQSIGNDPYFLLPHVPLRPDKVSWVSLEITGPEKTQLQMFYQTIEEPQFVERQSVRRELWAGRRLISFPLPPGLNGHFRLDPGNVKGNFRLHSCVFRQ
jgi:hypothetical protein